MENLDLKLINILINNRKELSDFASSAGEGIFDSDYKRFVKTLFNYYLSYKSPPTLNTLLEFCGNNSGLKDYISNVWNDAESNKTDQREYSFILNKIKKRYNSLILLSVKDKLENNLDDLDSVNNFLYKATNEIKNIGESKVKIECTLKNSAADYFEKFKAKQENKELNCGIMSGFSIFDFYTNGLRKGEFLLFSAISGAGKSLFMLNFAVNSWLYQNKFPKNKQELIEMDNKNLWKKGNNILFISLEMSGDEIKDRIISNLCSINSRDIMKGSINENDATKMSLALNFWKKYKYNFKIVDLPGCTMADLQDIYDETCNEFIPDLVVIDYLGIMGYSAKSENSGESTDDADWKKLLDLSKDIFNFARINDVATISAVQLTLTAPGKGGLGPHRIGRSRNVLGNVTIFLQLEDREDESSRPDSKIHCLKFRRGENFVINNLLKEFQYSRFVDQPTSNIEEQSKLSEEDLSLSIENIFGQDQIEIN